MTLPHRCGTYIHLHTIAHVLSSSAMIISESAASGGTTMTRSGLNVENRTVKSWSPSKAWS